jgi:hypothetical protein
MTEPDIQRFDQDGTWRKPPGAVRVDVTLKGGDGGDALRAIGAEALTIYAAGGGAGEVADSSGGAGSAASGASMAGAAGGGSLAAGAGDPATMASGQGGSGGPGELITLSYAASHLPAEVDITIGRGGRDGYAIITSYFPGGGGEFHDEPGPVMLDTISRPTFPLHVPDYRRTHDGERY